MRVLGVERWARGAGIGLLLASGCGGWSSPNTDDGGVDPGVAAPIAPPSAPRTLDDACYGVTRTLSRAGTATDGAFCFGVALGFGEGLACSGDGRQVLCAEVGVGSYVVRWDGAGRAYDPVTERALGSVTPRDARSFVVTTPVSAGVCTLYDDLSLPRAAFCPYVD